MTDDKETTKKPTNNDKFTWQPEDIVWDDARTQKKWEALHKGNNATTSEQADDKKKSSK